MTTIDSVDLNKLADNIKAWGKALGFQQIGICDVDLSHHETFLNDWLAKGYHGTMGYMETHGLKRARPAELVPGTLRAISVRYDYLPPNASFAAALKKTDTAYISRYALGRDYHKVVRNKLKKLGEKIQQAIQHTSYRPFVDSAPVLEHALAEKSGIGWTGKHSLTLNQEAGSWFFLGELLINLPLPVDKPQPEQCGSCNACITICPTQAIVAPYIVDARRCISYLTIEHEGAIDEALRPLMGNRIYGCDDCQLVCPFNRDAPLTTEEDFQPREVLFNQSLAALFAWSEEEFLSNTLGSPIRRIGYARWQRNLAIGLGNSEFSEETIDLLKSKLNSVDAVVDEHIQWAISQQEIKRQQGLPSGNAAQESTGNRQTDRLIRSIQKGMGRDA